MRVHRVLGAQNRGKKGFGEGLCVTVLANGGSDEYRRTRQMERNVALVQEGLDPVLPSLLGN